MQPYFLQGFFAANLIIVIIFLHKIVVIELIHVNRASHVFCNKNVDHPEMPDFSIFDISELYDLLAVYTKIYTRMLTLNLPPSEQFLYTKGIVEQLQDEVQLRIKKMEPESNGSIDGLIPAMA